VSADRSRSGKLVEDGERRSCPSDASSREPFHHLGTPSRRSTAAGCRNSVP